MAPLELAWVKYCSDFQWTAIVVTQSLFEDLSWPVPLVHYGFYAHNSVLPPIHTLRSAGASCHAGSTRPIGVQLAQWTELCFEEANEWPNTTVDVESEMLVCMYLSIHQSGTGAHTGLPRVWNSQPTVSFLVLLRQRCMHRKTSGAAGQGGGRGQYAAWRPHSAQPLHGEDQGSKEGREGEGEEGAWQYGSHWTAEWGAQAAEGKASTPSPGRYWHLYLQ